MQGFLTVAFLGLRMKGLWIVAELYLDRLLQISVLNWNLSRLSSQKAFQLLKCVGKLRCDGVAACLIYIKASGPILC